MNDITEKTVREIALENPSSIRVFETLGMDYCCGGKRSLDAACIAAGVPFERALQLLQAAGRVEPGTEPAWNDSPLAELIAHIVAKHHGFVRQEIPRLQALLVKVSRRHGLMHQEVGRIEQLFGALAQELTTHLLKEEQILFPYIARMEAASPAHEQLQPGCFGSVERPIATMVAEHEDAGALLAEIRQLSSNFTTPEGACPTYVGAYQGLEEFERDLHQHIHLENNILFPRAIALEESLSERRVESIPAEPAGSLVMGD